MCQPYAALATTQDHTATTPKCKISRDFIKADEFLVDDFRVGEERHIMFATSAQLSQLQIARRWFIDGTFKVVRRPFYQLLSVHAFVKSGECAKQVPLLFVLMSRRRKEDYIQVFRRLKERLGDPMVEWFMLDYEAAAWQAIRDATDSGCRPVEELTAYINDTWIDGRMWKVENWSVFRETVRTNNDVEGWHRRLNTRAGGAQLAFYILVPLLHAEAQFVDLQTRLVSQNILTRIHRKQYKTIHERLFQLWDDYEDEKKTTNQLLKEASRIMGLGPVTTTVNDHGEDET